MDSYEEEISEKVKNGEEIPERIRFSVLKYFWQVNPITGAKNKSIPRFLRSMRVLKNFSDYELKTLINYTHQRQFNAGEVIFNRGDIGIGFYLIFSGYVSVLSEQYDAEEDGEVDKQIALLEKGEYFGELSLLQDRNIRSATAIAKERTILLGLFKPDLEDLINTHPIVATKLLQSVSLIVSERLLLLTAELKRNKYKLDKLKGTQVEQN